MAVLRTAWDFKPGFSDFGRPYTNHRYQARVDRMQQRWSEALESTTSVGAPSVQATQPAAEVSLDDIDSVGASSSDAMELNRGLNHVDSVGEASLYEAPPAEVPSAAFDNPAGDATVQETAARADSGINEQLSQMQAQLQASMQSMHLQMMASLQSMGQQMAWQHASIIGLHEQQAVMANRLDLLLTTIVPEVLARLPSLRPASVQPRNSQPSVISEPPSLDDRNALAWAHDTTLVPEYRQLWWDAPVFVPIAVQRAKEWAAATLIQSAVRISIAKTELCRLHRLWNASILLHERRLTELRTR